MKNIFRISLCAFVFVLTLAFVWALDMSDNNGYALAGLSILPAVELRKNTRLRHLLTLSPNPATLPGPQREKLPRDFVYSYLIFRMTAQCDIAAGGGADGTLKAEQPWSLLRNIKLEASSPGRSAVAQILDMDFAALGVLNKYFGGAPVSTPLANAGIQAATMIDAQSSVFFYLPRCVNPRIGALNTHELSSLDIILDWGNFAKDLITGGTRVQTLSNIQFLIEGFEYLDDSSNLSRYAVNLIRNQELSSLSANSAYPVDLKKGNLLRGVLIKQFTQAAGETAHTPVDTVINGIRLMVNGVVKKEWKTNGTAASGWKLLQNQNKQIYELAAVSPGYAFIDLMEDGQLDGLYKGSDFTSLGLELDINTVADSRIRVYPIEIVDRDQ